MPYWNNKPSILYHGTDDISCGAFAQRTPLLNRLAFRVNLALCRPMTDFGQGFYLTSSDHQAREWANSRVRRMVGTSGPAPTATLLAFDIDRNWLSRLDHLVFPRAVSAFWDLVDDCRTGFVPHQRGIVPPCYDVVIGPVTIWPSRLVIQDCDQYSFHTQAAVNGLVNPVVSDYGTNPGNLF